MCCWHEAVLQLTHMVLSSADVFVTVECAGVAWAAILVCLLCPSIQRRLIQHGVALRISTA
jgi:hypothetical protein